MTDVTVMHTDSWKAATFTFLVITGSLWAFCQEMNNKERVAKPRGFGESGCTVWKRPSGNLYNMEKHVLLLLVLVAFTSLAVGNPTMQSESRRARQFNYSIAFESNAGQVHSEVKFISQRRNYQVFLTANDAVFVFSGTAQTPRTPENTWRASHLRLGSLQLRLVGTNPHANSEGRKTLSSYSNYLIGNDPRKWHTHVPQFAEVWSPAIYPGIDLVYYDNEGQLEYDFIVAPGANPNRIEFSISGSESGLAIHVNEHGDLVIPGRDGEVLLHKPLLYQGKSCSREKPNHAADEPGCKALNGGEFRVQHTSHAGILVSFGLPVYDHTDPLIIDPSVSFSTFLGGSMGDGVDGMTLDADGNIYLIGDTNSPDFPVTSGAYQKNLSGDTDAFVVKLSADGSHVIYATYLGGTGAEFPYAIALDSAKNVYLTGETYSTDFPLVHPYQTQNISGTGFVSKLSSDGSSLIYSTYLGGTLNGANTAIAVDSSGEAVVVGRTGSTDFPVVNAFQPAHAADNGSYDAFITKFSADGTSLVFSTYFGGDGNDYGQGVTLDSSGNIYVTGITYSTNFPTTPGTYQPTYIADPLNSFVAKFSPSGTSLTYSTYLVDCWAYAIAIDAAGNAFVTGTAGDFAFPVTPGAFQTVHGAGGGYDAFVTEFDSTASSWMYSTFLGGNNSDFGYAIALDSSDDAYVTGQTWSSDFPLQAPVQSTFYAGVPTSFVSELTSTGSALAFSTYWGGGAGGFGSSQANAIAVGGPGNIYMAGSTLTPDFPVVNPIQSQLLGPGDAFIAKFEVLADFVVSASPKSVTVSAGQPANYSLTLLPINGFAQSISLSCSGAPAGSRCTVSPSSLTLDGTHSGTATVTVTTTAPSGNVLGSVVEGTGFTPNRANYPRMVFGALCVLVALSLAIPMTLRRARRRALGVAALLLVGSFLVACGGGGSGGGGGGGGTPPGQYTIIVKTLGGSLNHSVNLTLDVN